MPRKAKTVAPPVTIWVIVDAYTGNPTLVLRNPPDEKFELMDGEAVYVYKLKEDK